MAAAQRAHGDSTSTDREGEVLDERSVLGHLEPRPPIDPLRPSTGIANGLAIGFAIWLVIAAVAVVLL